MYNSQYIADRIKTLAKIKKITVAKMLSDCGLNKNSLSTMQSGGSLPRTENLAKIADYLDCSVDYLLGRIDIPGNKREFTTSEQKLINNYRQLNEEGQGKLLDNSIDLISSGRYVKSENSEINPADTLPFPKEASYKIAAYGADGTESTQPPIEEKTT